MTLWRNLHAFTLYFVYKGRHIIYTEKVWKRSAVRKRGGHDTLKKPPRFYPVQNLTTDPVQKTHSSSASETIENTCYIYSVYK